MDSVHVHALPWDGLKLEPKRPEEAMTFSKLIVSNMRLPLVLVVSSLTITIAPAWLATASASDARHNSPRHNSSPREAMQLAVQPRQSAAMVRLNQQFSAAVILPAYEALAEQTEGLVVASQAFEASPTEANLMAVRAAWLGSAASWAESRAFAFGPVHSLGYSAALESPCDAASIEALLQNRNDIQQLKALDSAKLRPALQGFDAMAYVLNGEAGEKAAADFSAEERMYLHQLAAIAHRNTSALLAVWQDGWNGYPAYKTALTTAGQPGNSAYLSSNVAAEEIIRTAFNRLDVMVGEELPELLEEPDADTDVVTLQLLSSSLQGIQTAYFGQKNRKGNPTRGGISSLVSVANPEVNQQIQRSLYIAQYGMQEAIANPSSPQSLEMSLNALAIAHKLLEAEVLPLVQS